MPKLVELIATPNLILETDRMLQRCNCGCEEVQAVDPNKQRPCCVEVLHRTSFDIARLPEELSCFSCRERVRDNLVTTTEKRKDFQEVVRLWNILLAPPEARSIAFVDPLLLYVEVARRRWRLKGAPRSLEQEFEIW